MSYYNDIDPIGEGYDENEECSHCGAPEVNYKGYCSRTCYKYDNE